MASCATGGGDADGLTSTLLRAIRIDTTAPSPVPAHALAAASGRRACWHLGEIEPARALRNA
jgi:hypothetical protein